MPPKTHLVFDDNDDVKILNPSNHQLNESTDKDKYGLKRHGDSESSPSFKPSKKLKKKHRNDNQFVSNRDPSAVSPATLKNPNVFKDDDDDDDKSSPKPKHKEKQSKSITQKQNGFSREIKKRNKRNIKHGKDVRFLDSEDEEDLIGNSDDSDSSSDSNMTVKRKHHGANKKSLKETAFESKQKLKTELFKTRKSLPMYQARKEVINRILNNDVTILLGETGSGKSTQLPQMLYEASLNGPNGSKRKERIAITQPRRVAAISLATRVGQEMGSTLGEKVGYSVRFKNMTDPHKTHIKYLTDGMLLRELMISPDLHQYTTVILDEAHERTLLTDLSMGLLKKLQEKRKDTKSPLKIIVMSATLDAERFSKFFDGAEILLVEGKMYPVDRYYLTEPVDDIVDSMVQSICQVNLSEPTGDILSFLPGQDEIEKVVQRLNEIAKDLPKEAPLLVALPLYASLPSTAQQKAFEPLPKNRRKVICATNIAETSLTVPGVRYVVDSGLRKVKVFRPELGMDTLLTVPISKAAASQRMGRAGREAPGKCFRLFTEKTYSDDLPKQTEAEITRTDVSSAILLLKRAGVNDVLGFDWVESPGKRAIKSALLKLYGLKALDDSGKITELGRKMALLPVPPQLAAVLIQAQVLGGLRLLSTVIDVAACLSVEGLVMNPHPEKREEINEKRRHLFSGSIEWGDLVMLKEAYDMYLEIQGFTEKKIWCKEVGINYKAMKNVLRVRQQIKGYMETILELKNGKKHKKNKKKKNKIRGHREREEENESDDDSDDEDDDELNTKSNGQFDIKNLLKCFLFGYIGSTAIGLPDGRYRSTINGQMITIHPSSMLFGQKREAIMYMELVYTQKPYARAVSPIHIECLNEIAPHLLK